nr:AAA family ATPase [Fervidicoccus fontis]
MPNNVIVIGGPAGSGKTTYSTYIAKKLGFSYVSSGMIFRSIAKERGLSISELNELAEKDSSIDYYIDRRTLEEAMKGNVVLEGHLAPWIVSNIADLKIYFNASLKTRVMRIAEREKRNWKDVLIETAKREYSQAMRFKKMYGIDVLDLSIFDFIVSTEKLTIEQVKFIVDQIIEYAIENKKIQPASI